MTDGRYLMHGARAGVRLRLVLGWVAMIAVIAMVREADAFVSFGKQQARPEVSGALATDFRVDLATDGAGTFVAVWESDELFDGELCCAPNVLFSRSTDGGRTWTSAAVIATPPLSGAVPAVAYDGAGTWVVVWEGSFVSDMSVSRSTDGGVTWSVPVALGAQHRGSLGGVRLNGNGAGTLLLTLSSDEDPGATLGTDRDIIYFRSIDGGMTWSSPLPLNSAAVSDGDRSDGDQELTTDGAGNWLAVWQSVEDGDSDVVGARSTDDGQTWSASFDVSFSSAGTVGSADPTLDTDGNGRWFVAWSTDPTTPPAGFPGESGVDVAFSVSEDLGVSWSPATLVTDSAVTASTFVGELNPILRYGGDDRLVTMWWTLSNSFYKGTVKGESDHDLFMARSLDGGSTWNTSSLVNNRGVRDDGYDIPGAFEFDDAGNWVAVWSSGDDLDDTVGSDRDIMLAHSGEDCSPVPEAGCLASTRTGGGRIKLQNPPAGKRDRLTWKLKKLADTTGLDLGEPVSFDSESAYTLCLYDGLAGERKLVLEKDLPGAAECRGSPCWRTTDSGKLRFRDARYEYGAVRSLLLSPGTGGQAKLKLKADSAILGPPVMPLGADPDVTLQLVNQETGACWETVVTAPTKNTDEKFEGRSD